MTTLYALAQQNNYLVLGTNNADERYIGYFTKYGDGGVDLAPIIHLLKKDIKKIAKILGVNKQIINRQPTAGLWKNQTDENELNFTYKVLDNYLMNKQISQKDKEKIENLHQKSKHKQNWIKIPLKKFRNIKKI